MIDLLYMTLLGMLGWLVALALYVTARVSWYAMKAIYYDFRGDHYRASYSRLRARGYK